jgi:hypothetical protein
VRAQWLQHACKHTTFAPNTVCARRTRLAAHRCYSGMRDAHVWVNPSQRNVCLRACVHMQAALSAANLTDALKAQVRVGVAYV